MELSTVRQAYSFTQWGYFNPFEFNILCFSCTNCPNLELLWKQLAERLSNTEELVVAKVDCSAQNKLCQGIETYIMARKMDKKLTFIYKITNQSVFQCPRANKNMS